MNGLRLVIICALLGTGLSATAQQPIALNSPASSSDAPLIYESAAPFSVSVAQQPQPQQSWPPAPYVPAGPPPDAYYGQQPLPQDPILGGYPASDPIFGEGPQRPVFRALLGLNEPLFLPNYYDPFASQQFAYGCVTTTPYRLGWYSYQEAVYIASASTSVGGKFQATELNGSMRYATLLNERLLFAGTGAWNSRYWSGPTGIAMPPHVDQFVGDLQLSTLDPGPWNWMIGVTPQINSDFERQLTSDAYMVDARVVLFNKISPQLTLALGAAYWDRANNYFIPYGGVVWTPDNHWEIRAMFPKSRVSYYVGNLAQADVWLYGAAEYNVDAYQIDFDDATRLKDRAEFRDYRFLLGITAQGRRWSAFFEGGYITDRHVDFKGKTPGFSIDDSWLLRTGFSY